MKPLRILSLVPALAASLLLAAPASSLAGDKKKITVYRDNDGDGHYNKKTYSVNGNYYGNSYYGGRPYGYYGARYYSPSYYRSYPYYRPNYYSRPSVSFGYSRPAYSSSGAGYSDALAVEVQRELRRRGYYRGAIDGDVGPGTRAAIRAYQDDRNLPVTGRIDRSLLRALEVN